MTAVASLRNPGPRAGIASTRSSAHQCRDRPVAQRKRRPHKGGARFNDNRPHQFDPSASEPAPIRSSTQGRVPRSDESPKKSRGFCHAHNPLTSLRHNSTCHQLIYCATATKSATARKTSTTYQTSAALHPLRPAGPKDRRVLALRSDDRGRSPSGCRRSRNHSRFFRVQVALRYDLRRRFGSRLRGEGVTGRARQC
jgi:hypothetical protein